MQIHERVAASGIVGMGGAAFPSAVKLALGTQNKLDTLLLNGAECEPYLTCDDRVMREYADEVIDGARIMAHALGAPKVIVAIEENKPQAIAIMTKAAASIAGVEVVGRAGAVPDGFRAPSGAGRHRPRNPGAQTYRRPWRGGAQRRHGPRRTPRRPLWAPADRARGHGERRRHT